MVSAVRYAYKSRLLDHIGQTSFCGNSIVATHYLPTLFRYGLQDPDVDRLLQYKHVRIIDNGRHIHLTCDSSRRWLHHAWTLPIGWTVFLVLLRRPYSNDTRQSLPSCYPPGHIKGECCSRWQFTSIAYVFSYQNPRPSIRAPLEWFKNEGGNPETFHTLLVLFQHS